MEINITIKTVQKSINPCVLNLPEFSMITGRNGSGKSHLLQAIAEKDKTDVIINKRKCTNIKLLQFGGLIPNMTETFNKT